MTTQDVSGAPPAPRPGVSAPEPWQFPVAATTTLPNQMTLIAYDVPGQYVFSVRLAVPAPLAAEPRAVEGVGTIMARTLDEGTLRHTAEEMAELLERKGIALGAGMAEHGLVVDLDVAQRHLGPALELLTECVTEATFPEAEVARHVRTRLADIEQEYAGAGSRAALEFISTFFADSDRASRPAGGSRQSVQAITAEDVRAFHAEHVRPDAATVVVAGDFSGLDVAAEVARTLGSWEAGPRAEVAERVPRSRVALDAARIVFVDRPGSVQTELYLGCPGPDRRVEGGWAPYPVLSFVVGGSPHSRIDAVLREEKGYTYGIRCGFRPRAHGGLFVTSGSVRADATAESVGLALEILDGARDGFTEAETTSGIDFIAKTAPGRYATADAIADEAVMLALDGLTTEFTTRNLQELERLTPGELQEAYDRYVTGQWTVVLVGDAGAYAEAVQALGRGEVTIV